MRGRDRGRQYRRTHPWIRFGLNPRDAPARVWLLLGQVTARAELLAEALIPESESRKLHRTFLVKGARATAAIEGNTLTEAEVEERRLKQRNLPPSRAYLGVEVDNVLAAYNRIAEEVLAGGAARLDRGRIEDWNRRILDGLEGHIAEEAVPGVVRSHPVVTGRYRGAPAEDCVRLLERLVHWLERDIEVPATARRGDPWGFVLYALEGLVDGLREQASLVEREQRRLAWPGFVRDRIGGRPGPARERRTNLALVLGGAEAPLTRAALLDHARLARAYARRTGKTLTRDLNWLIETEIVEVPNPGHPYGVRGVGEVPIVPPAPAIANAIADAIGLRMRGLPMSPRAIIEELLPEDE